MTSFNLISSEAHVWWRHLTISTSSLCSLPSFRSFLSSTAKLSSRDLNLFCHSSHLLSSSFSVSCFSCSCWLCRVLSSLRRKLRKRIRRGDMLASPMAVKLFNFFGYEKKLHFIFKTNGKLNINCEISNDFFFNTEKKVKNIFYAWNLFFN